MSIVKEKYSPNRINLLYQMLQNDKEQGNPRDYDIKVDELKVVQRTDDPERFFTHEEFVQPGTGCITINIYDGSSRRCTKYQLYFGDVQMNGNSSTLAGVESAINEKISNERKQWEYEQMKKDKEVLEAKLDESEEYAEGLEEKLEEIQQEFQEYKFKRVGMAEMSTGKMLGFATDYLVKNHPSIAQKIPLLSGLSGFFTGEETMEDGLGAVLESPAAREMNASFVRKSPKDANPHFDPARESKLAFFRQMEEAFTGDQLEKVVLIIQQLSAKTELLDTVYELVQDDTGKEKEVA
jgi:hypothetical protein